MPNKNALPPDTVLNEKYNILMPIGDGGFSITYLAERITDGEIFAIKEFFNEEYMVRSVPDVDVELIDPNHDNEKLHVDIRRFKNEWQIMNSFSHLRGLAHPIDFFEENNTAYIVMEHLSGGSMKDHIRTKGKIDQDVLLERLQDILELLTEMHASGFVHRDISPENLVMDAQDHYRLIDFGAVTRRGDSLPFNEQIRKEGYTPAEVFQPGYRSDPRSDVYSLCASCYYALTGIEPEDSIERSVFDELKPILEILPEMDPVIAKTIMSGISMSIDDRLSSITLFREAIVQHRKTEKERKDEAEAEKRKKNKRKAVAVVVSLILAIIAAFVFCLTHREFVKFKGKDTQEFAFYYRENMAPEDVDALRESITLKFDHLIGQNNYLVDTEAGYIRITALYDPFAGKDIPSLLNKAFSFSECQVGYYDDYGIYSTIAQLGKEDIADANGQDDVSIISLQGNVTKKLKELTEQDGDLILRIYTEGDGNQLWDRHNHPNEGEWYDIAITYDPNYEQIKFYDDTPNSAYSKIILDCLTDNSEKIESFNYERHIIWELRQNTYWGEDQTDIGSLKGEYVILTYTCDDYDEDQGRILGKTIREEEIDTDTDTPTIVLLKNRLDSLNTPYACGWEENNPLELQIAIDPDRIWEIEAAILFDELSTWSMSFESPNIGAYGTFNIRSVSGIAFPAIDITEPIKTADSTITVKIEDIFALDDILMRLKELGEDEVQLCIGNRPVFQTSVAEIDENGYITFTDPIIDNTDEATLEDNLGTFVEYLNTMAGDVAISDHRFAGATFVNAKGRILWNKDLWDMNGCEIKTLRMSIGEFASSLPDNSMEVEWKSHVPSVVDIVCYFEKLGEIYSHPYEIVSDLFQSVEWTNEVTDINFVVYAGENRNTWYYMDTYRSRINGKICFRWAINYWNNNEEYSDPEAHDRQVKEDNEIAVKFLSSEDIFTDNLLSPATSYCQTKAKVDNEDILLVISAQNTLQGQDYCIEEHMENRTDKEMSVYLNSVSINNNMPVFTESVASLAPGETGTYIQEFSLDDFHYTNYDAFHNGIFRYRICSEDKETIEELIIPNMVQNKPLFDYTNIPEYARLVKDTEEYSIYSLGYGWTNKVFGPSDSIKESRFIIVNKTERTLCFTVENLAYNQVWNDAYISEETLVLPYSAEYYAIDSLSYIIQNPKEVTAKISVGTEDSNGKYSKLETFDIDVGIKQTP